MSAPLPTVPNVIKAVLEGTTSFAKNWATIFHWLYSGTPPTAAALSAIASEFAGAFATEFKPLAPPQTAFVGATVTDLSTVSMPMVFEPFAAVGTSTADKLPANCATLISYSVSLRYRGGHPRNYLYIGTDENLLNESEWNTDYVTSVNEALSNFVGVIDGFASGGTTLTDHVAVSYFGGVPTVGGVSQRREVPLVLPLSTGSASQKIASQRRRLGR